VLGSSAAGKGNAQINGQIKDLIQCIPLATETGISLIILPLMSILQRNLKRTTDTFLFIFHITNVILFKFCCNIFIGVRIIKEMSGSVASGTQRIINAQNNHESSLPWFFLYILVLGTSVLSK